MSVKIELSHQLKIESAKGKVYNILVFDFLKYKMNVLENLKKKSGRTKSDRGSIFYKLSKYQSFIPAFKKIYKFSN